MVDSNAEKPETSVQCLKFIIKIKIKIKMRKGVDMWTLSAKILTDCGNCLLETLNFSFICFLKLKYYLNFT